MRKILTLLAATLALATSLPALAYKPDRPICIAPAKPGGGFDLTCRVAATGLLAAGQLSRPMEVQFMPGGIGAVAYNHMNYVSDKEDDIIVAFSAGSLLNIAEGKFGRRLDENDARWVAAAGTDYGAVVVRADSPYHNLGELMDALRKDPGAVTIGAGGSVGSQDWMKAALLFRAAGVPVRSMRYVAFEGGGESKAAVLGGHIKVYTGDVSELIGDLDAGDLRVLAVMSDQRLPGRFAELPTAREQGFDVEWPVFRGYYIGKNTSDAAYQTWIKRFQATYRDPAFKKLLDAQGLFPMEMTGSEFTEFVKKKTAEYRKLALEIGLIRPQDL